MNKSTIARARITVRVKKKLIRAAKQAKVTESELIRRYILAGLGIKSD